MKDEPPKENTLWMVQRDTGINGNLAKVKFKLRISRGDFFSLLEGLSKPKSRNVITGTAEIREDSQTFGKITVHMLLLFLSPGRRSREEISCSWIILNILYLKPKFSSEWGG